MTILLWRISLDLNRSIILVFCFRGLQDCKLLKSKLNLIKPNVNVYYYCSSSLTNSNLTLPNPTKLNLIKPNVNVYYYCSSSLTNSNLTLPNSTKLNLIKPNVNVYYYCSSSRTNPTTPTLSCCTRTRSITPRP
jgi:hypothetical protein